MVDNRDNNGMGKGAPGQPMANSVPAAMYARMSTEHQQYSTENQADLINQYAKKHCFEVVETYVDKGKSGLNIAGRESLQKLIEEVQTGQARFKAILVYDVSRWGRFQDADESAYYEYICKRAGIDVHYCAEQFKNDGSTGSTIIKTVKRAMAGEYSRELSSKVFQGQCRLIQLGFRQGGTAGYGLRRILIDPQGNEKGELRYGEHKSLQTDRVVLRPGPAAEVSSVRWMYRAFVNESLSESDIANALNAKGVKTDLGRRWTRGSVRQVLTNEKYIGNNVYNRRSFKLKQRRVANPPAMWVRMDGAFEGIVNAELFYKAQGIMLERNRRYTEEEMLERLKTLYAKHGRISGILIDETEGMPSSTAYSTRFGGLIRAYSLVGFNPEGDYGYIEINKHLRKMHPELVTRIVSELTALGSSAEWDGETGLLLLNQEILVSIVLSRCTQSAAGSKRWQIRLDRAHGPDITVVARMDDSNREILDFYLLPTIDMNLQKLRLHEQNGVFLDTYRYDDLAMLYRVTERANVGMVA